jgi:peptidoglycan/xylan/chitin deacetylase (PgdA/CDA1 family)
MRTLILAMLLALYQLPALAAGQIPVLLYHHVDYDDSLYSVHPERLEADLVGLRAAGYRTVSLAAVASFLAGKGDLPEKPVLLTFDDGYADNCRYAYPLLKKYGMTAVFFVVTGYLGGGGTLTAAEIRTMAAGGMEFAVHTDSHPLLTDVGDEQLRTELTDSKKQLAVILGVDPGAMTAMAYPGGSADLRVRRAAVAAGFSLAFATTVGLIGRDSSPSFLPRIPIFAASRSALREIAAAAARTSAY